MILDKELERTSSVQSAMISEYEIYWRNLTLSIQAGINAGQHDKGGQSCAEDLNVSVAQRMAKMYIPKTKVNYKQVQLWKDVLLSNLTLQICPTVKMFASKVASYSDNDWFIPAVRLFNKSAAWRMYLNSSREAASLCSEIVEKSASWKLNFVSFLGVTDIDDVRQWDTAFLDGSVEFCWFLGS